MMISCRWIHQRARCVLRTAERDIAGSPSLAPVLTVHHDSLSLICSNPPSPSSSFDRQTRTTLQPTLNTSSVDLKMSRPQPCGNCILCRMITIGSRYLSCSMLDDGAARASSALWLLVQIDFAVCATNVGLGERWWDMEYFVSACEHHMLRCTDVIEDVSIAGRLCCDSYEGVVLCRGEERYALLRYRLMSSPLDSAWHHLSNPRSLDSHELFTPNSVVRVTIGWGHV
ncbi:hypothetical protein K491DRAFT_339644 [Lophiostoma macrostomum CBS 122681]|uniref:Uncharacterized protein n=1 Tax=Lophiostoma macrostomum CBS 122681 TaxID=1314788 RepID=A0A6A6TPQ7_9PLEO|nr:hypothetical protein K491DRAFT_339644 [Lophiostoma macrostomum CBS 122681]